MNQEPQITFHNVNHSDAVEAAILNRLEKLDSAYRGLGTWHVVVDAPHHRHQKGNHYHVRVGISLKGKAVLVGHPHDKRHAKEDIYEAVNETFDAVERQLQTFRQKRLARRNHRAPRQAYA